MRNCDHLLLVLAALMLISAGASAQFVSYDVYWADDTNGDIWAYPDTIGTVISPPASFSSVTALAISQGGGVLVGQYFDGIKRIDPVSLEIDILDPYAYNVGELCEDGESGDIFWINGSGYYEMWLLDPDIGTSEVVYSFDGQPLDIDVIPGGAHAGNLLVLVESYIVAPMIVEMERTQPFTFTVVDTVATMSEDNPRAFSFMPDGTIIVVDSNDGMSLYDIDDGYIGQFGTFQTTGLEDISVGSDGTVYVHDTNYGIVRRFSPSGAELPQYLTGPVEGGPIEAVGFVPTPPGSNVPVSPLPNVDVLFEEVTNGGYTTAETFVSSSRTSPGGNTIPTYADPPGGRSDFTYITATTSAVYENLIQVDIYLPGSRFFVAQGTGGEFRDVTVVGSIEDARGVISRFDSPIEVPGGDRLIEGPTEFVLVEDTRPTADVVDAKFADLIDILTGDADSPSAVKNLVYIRKYLLRRTLRAHRLYVLGDEPGAIAELAMMNSDIRLLAGWRIPNSSESPYGNIAGGLLSRSKTLMFSLGLLAKSGDGTGIDETIDRLALTAPNPVYGECRMQLTGPAGVRAVAAVYTVSGRLVTTLFDGELKGGSPRELVWDGTDDSGRKVASGVYMTRVMAGAEVATSKLVLIR